MVKHIKTSFLNAVLWSLLTPSAFAAAGFSLSPTSVNNKYQGIVTVTITGLEIGETIILEKFLDLNADNSVDAGEPVVQRFQLTDGFTNTLADVRNANVPSDDGSAETKRIVTRLNFMAGSEINQAVGKFRFRLSSPTARFGASEHSFTVNQASYSQSIAGTVYVGAAPLANAVVALTDPVWANQIVSMIVAGNDGKYALQAPPGQYRIVAFKPGAANVGCLGSTNILNLLAGQKHTANNLINTPTSRLISGLLTESGSASALPGAQLLLLSASGNATIAFTDASGFFSVPVSPSAEWAIRPSAASLAQLGCVALSADVIVDASVADASNDIAVPAATALIYGTLTDELGNWARSTMIEAPDYDGLAYSGAGFTAMDGTYTIGVIAGNNWYVQPEPGRLARQGYLGQGSPTALLDGEAVPLDLPARTVNAHLRGQVLREDGSPVAWMPVSASSFDGFSAYGLSTTNGDFDLGVFGGDWTIQLSETEAINRNLVQPALPTLSLADAETLSGITSVVRRVSGMITGSVQDTNQTPVSGLFATAETTAAGYRYAVSAATDDTGHYELPVFDGTWQVSPGEVGFLGYVPVSPQDTIVVQSTNTVNFMLEQLGPLEIDTVALPQALVNTPYRVQLQAHGGASPYLWVLASAAPSGLNLGMDGTISGEPNQSGIYSLTTQVMDNFGNTANKDFSLTVSFPARFTAIAQTVQGKITLQLTGKPNQAYILEAAESLDSAIWTPVATNSAASGVITLLDSNPTAPLRFYRAREQ